MSFQENIDRINWSKSKSLSVPGTPHYCCEKGDLKKLHELVERGLHAGHPVAVTLAHRESVLGLLPLHVAAEAGKVEIVEVRSNAVCVAASKNDDSAPSLCDAQYLLRNRVDVDALDAFRVTALHLAAIEDHLEVCRTLLEAFAAVNAADNEGDLPIHWAATKGHSDVSTACGSAPVPCKHADASHGYQPACPCITFALYLSIHTVLGILQGIIP